MTDKIEKTRERKRLNKQAERARKAERGIKELRNVFVKKECYAEAQERSRVIIKELEEKCDE